MPYNARKYYISSKFNKNQQRSALSKQAQRSKFNFCAKNYTISDNSSFLKTHPNARIYSFKQVIELPNIVTTANPNPITLFARSFKLADVPDLTHFSGLFDQYRICGVTWNIFPHYTMAWVTPTTAAASVPPPQIYTAIDYDDAKVPSDLVVLQQYTTCKYMFFNKTHTRYIKPRCVSYSLLTGASTSYGNLPIPPDTWIDVAYDQVQHYGLLGAIVYPTTASGDQTQSYTLRNTATYYLQFRYSR